MTKEKSPKAKKDKETDGKDDNLQTLEQVSLGTDILTPEDLKKFLSMIRDRMSDGSCPASYALSALSHVLTLPNVYQTMTDDNREIARDIWLRLKQAGFHIKSPPMLFEELV